MPFDDDDSLVTQTTPTQPPSLADRTDLMGRISNTSERHDVHRQAFLDHYCRCGRAQLSAYPPVGLLLIARLYETLAVKLYTVPL